MKTLILVIAGLGLLAGVVVHFAQRNSPPPAGSNAPDTAVAAPVEEPAQAEPAPGTATPQPATRAPDRATTPATPARTPATTPSATTPSLPFQQALATLTSGQATFMQKQAAWQRVKDAGHLDQLITELEQRASANPNAAEYPATLGQAYLQKAGTIKDLREQGILGLKADQSFDAALNLDPSNWEAGFWKAMAMSFWPPQLGKSQEVLERFVELVKLQETQAPQPQFAQTYLMLGDQYQKQGYADYAKQVWQRGAALFPNDPKLSERLSQPQLQTEQTAAR